VDFVFNITAMASVVSRWQVSNGLFPFAALPLLQIDLTEKAVWDSPSALGSSRGGKVRSKD
jgi:hypothetical protein